MAVASLHTGFSLCGSSVSFCDVALTISSHQHFQRFFLHPSSKRWHLLKTPTCLAAISRNNNSGPDENPSPNPSLKPKRSTSQIQNSKSAKNEVNDPNGTFTITKPKRTRRGRKSEAAAVEDLVRGKLERTFASIREQNPEILKDWGRIIKEKVGDDEDDDIGSEDSGNSEAQDHANIESKMVVEEEDPNWPLDADVGWGTRASEYFENYPIKNVLDEDGFEIDWEGEVDNGLVKEINCLEWESFAFRPSPLVVLVFERYNRSSENWKVLKELEKAAEVYWKCKDRLPPRTVKLDINIEKDLAYALKVKECPQILFLRGNRILHREKEMRTAEELVQMMAHFYYNAKKPTCIK
ncbi:OLC1v1021824C1 [Oldenlandia corymbosa var. corymbosa]|uniref:OLC1v1021824C1 n=1 Tax=Oldenlandia corymbosa var. corymbosa TaxID=529605 RepID=A0AAV1BX58_OLDCO|nr:OLC1v1021824C1 [Oldenlandia corymbosa var. corymbosa]